MHAQADRPCSALAYGDVKRVGFGHGPGPRPAPAADGRAHCWHGPGRAPGLMALTRQIARERRMGVLFTEHSMDVVFGQADRVLVLVRGRLLAEGTPEQIQADARVQEAIWAQALMPGGPHEQPPPAPLLQVQGLNAWYGARRFCLTCRCRWGVVRWWHPHGPQRRFRQIDHAQGPSWAWWRGAVACSFGQDNWRERGTTLPCLGPGLYVEERRIFTDLSVMDNPEVGRQRPRRWPDGTPAPEWTPEKLFALFPTWANAPAPR